MRFESDYNGTPLKSKGIAKCPQHPQRRAQRISRERAQPPHCMPSVSYRNNQRFAGSAQTTRMRLANAQQNQSQTLLSLTCDYELQALANSSHCPIRAREGGGVNVCVCNAPTFKHGN